MSTKPIAIVDGETGEWLFDHVAFASPNEPGKYDHPTHSTEKTRPALAANQVAVFCFTDALAALYGGVLNEWKVLPDYRSDTWFDSAGNPVEITSIIPPAGLSANLPAELALKKAKSDQSYEISTAAQAAITGGFLSAALGAANTYPSTLIDQQNINSVAMVGGSIWCADATTGVWSLTAHTKAQAATVQADMVAWIQQNQIKSAAKKTAITAAKTVAEVGLVVW